MQKASAGLAGDAEDSAPESGQPAGGREPAPRAEPDDPDGDWRSAGPPPEAAGEDF